MTIRPDVPAAARLMEAARSLRLEAQALRTSFPGRRASSSAAEVDVEAGGRVLAMRLLDPRHLPSDEWASHLSDLYRAATGTPVDGAVVQDLITDEFAAADAGLGPSRFTFPPGIDADAPPDVVLAQLNTRLSSRFAAAETASARIAELDGIGTSSETEITVRIGSVGHLLELRIASRLGRQSLDSINALLAETLRAAQDDLRRQIDEALSEEGI